MSRKKDDGVAVEAAAPPPSAYPTTPAGYAETGSTTPTSPSSMAPAPAAPEPPAFQLREGETLVSYRIEPGDNLGKIAAKYNTSVPRIKAANGMTDDRIYAGKSLQIPTAAPPGLALNAPVAPRASNSYGSPFGVGSATGAPAGSAGTSAGSSGASAYPSITDPAPAVSPSSTSYPPVPAPPIPPIPPQPQQPAGAFPTPSFGGGGVQFSD